jgi:hypothetical protein
MSLNDDMYKEQALAEAMGLEGGAESIDRIKQAAEEMAAKALLMEEYPRYPGAVEAVTKIIEDDEIGKAFKKVLQVDDVKDVVTAIMAKVSEEYGDVSVIMGVAYLISELYVAMEKVEPKGEGKSVLIALKDAFLKKNVGVSLYKVEEE